MANRKDDIKAQWPPSEVEEHSRAVATHHPRWIGSCLPPGRAVLEATFREVHTLKGAAHSVLLAEMLSTAGRRRPR
jgi:chemotaxis protein histidine kinase CheA